MVQHRSTEINLQKTIVSPSGAITILSTMFTLNFCLLDRTSEMNFVWSVMTTNNELQICSVFLEL